MSGRSRTWCRSGSESTTGSRAPQRRHGLGFRVTISSHFPVGIKARSCLGCSGWPHGFVPDGSHFGAGLAWGWTVLGGNDEFRVIFFTAAGSRSIPLPARKSAARNNRSPRARGIGTQRQSGDLFGRNRQLRHRRNVADFAECPKLKLPSRLRRGVNGYLEVLDRSREEMSDLAVKVFELSQTLTEKWLTADYATKRRILEIVFLNFSLVDASLCPQMRKPFDVLAEGRFVPLSRADRI